MSCSRSTAGRAPESARAQARAQIRTEGALARSDQRQGAGVSVRIVPGRALVAWDFGPADGPVAPGFERVLPNDERIGGADELESWLAGRKQKAA